MGDDSDGAQPSTYSFTPKSKHQGFEMKENTFYEDRTSYETTKRFTLNDRGNIRDTNFTTRKQEDHSLKLPASSVRQDFLGDYRASKERILAQSWAREEKPTSRNKERSSSSYVDRKEEKAKDNTSYRHSTLLVKARSPGASSVGDNLPVVILAARGGGDEQEDTNLRKRTSRQQPQSQNERTKEQYHSDKSFSNHFLNSNPKLEDMLKRKEK